jgi:predicted transcriptional regulator
VEDEDDEATRAVARRLWNQGRSRAEIAERLAVRPKQVSRWLEEEEEPPRKREKRERSNVERAMEVVSRLSAGELEEFQARMARLSGYFGGRGSAGREVHGEVVTVEG